MRSDRILRALVRHRFVVTMVDDQTWDGVVMEADAQTIVLRDVAAVVREGETVKRVPADGEVLLPRSRVAYMQRTIERTPV